MPATCGRAGSGAGSDADFVAAGVLGLVELLVRAPQQRLNRVVGVGQRGPGGYRHPERRLFPQGGLRDHGSQPLPHLGQPQYVGTVGDHGNELLAAPPPHDVERPRIGIQRPGYQLEYLVARFVPVPVVDSLEVVDIDVENSKWPFVPSQLREPGLEMAFNIPSG